ncbi:tyrosine lyase ThiH [Heliophilum fasciatum]|uniref:Tyrosine lyase ThiH n=1 Tax=Heliophilum fasciatum TaxID=35700 RepID=A0A4R2RMG5_9FIRM|nr:2-iminoacetate synthase ThiH [Heliophilum fasciatum]MCW2277527.1 2-iminoacetate synthase [Heliophilum fasciatum]TCP65182.1 tyrosine lyase ThiH [Heliophilum fasciatum]
MSFYDQLHAYREFDVAAYCADVTPNQVARALQKDQLSPLDFLALLAPAAEPFLEAMAQKAHQLTKQHFGRTILLYTPLYLSNYCSNRCVYCSFAAHNRLQRKQLRLDEVEREAALIAASGLKHILLLTGDAPEIASLDYLADAIAIIKKYFTCIGVELYALDEAGYRRLIAAGVDQMTLYQETYDEARYDQLHLWGPKKDFRFRLDAPEAACRAGMRNVNIGALLGLAEWQRDAFFTALHGLYLQERYPSAEISFSLPRIRPHKGAFAPACLVTDKQMVQLMTALRLWMPRAGITISTRETAQFRNHIVPLGVTKMSAGVSTSVGGHGEPGDGEGQFEIADPRDVSTMAAAITGLGYQPVFKDWQVFEP